MTSSVRTALIALVVMGLGAQGAVRDWEQGQRSNRKSKLWFTAAVSHSAAQLEALEARFWDVSNPSSVSFTDFISRDELTSLMTPPSEHLDSVVAWLESVGPTVTRSSSRALNTTSTHTGTPA